MNVSSAPNDPIGSGLFVLDAWPVLEWAYSREPVVFTFRKYLEAANQGDVRLVISRINLGEIKYNFFAKKKRGELPDIELDVDSLPFKVLSIDDALVDEAANLKTLYPISYADCFVAALAIRHKAPVITGDPDFQKLRDLGVLEVEWLGA